MTSWIYNFVTDAWRRTSLVQRGQGYACRLDGQVLLFGSVVDETGALYAAGDWRWHPRQVPPCRVCGDVLASPGRGWLVRDDVCARCQTDGGADPAADFTARRIELRERRAA